MLHAETTQRLSNGCFLTEILPLRKSLACNSISLLKTCLLTSCPKYSSLPNTFNKGWFYKQSSGRRGLFRCWIFVILNFSYIPKMLSLYTTLLKAFDIFSFNTPFELTACVINAIFNFEENVLEIIPKA